MSNAVRALEKTLDKITAQLGELGALAEDERLLGLEAPSVSAWSVGEQIEHLRRSDQTIIRSLGSLPDDGPVEGTPSLAGRAVLILGFIPRGAGKAPKATQPLEVDAATLPAQLADVSREFAALAPEFERLGHCRTTIRHPALGHFTASQMLAFAEIHHRHHMKIIRDIRRAKPATAR